MLKKISIVGGGEIGKAISFIASGANIVSSVWDKDPAKSSSSSPEECFKETEVVFFCVPSSALRTALTELSPVLPSNIPLIFVSKGLEAESRLSAPELAAEFVEKERIVFMGGPMIAEEIMEGKGGRAVLGGPRETAILAGQVFTGKNVSAETADDAFSVAILGVLKNVYAMAFGAAEGAKIGDNVKSYLFTKSVSEMNDIARALGGKVSVLNTAGIGDFLATSINPGSNNREAGFGFATGKNPEKPSEGMASVFALASKFREKSDSQMGIMSFVLSMVENKSVSEEDWNKILK
ncbi:MAG: hypothetical protein WC519_02855 [Parcubacteria group bacterium]